MLFLVAHPSYPQNPDEPIFRASASLVSLDFAVLDRRSAPVTGLRSDDFLLFEDGQPRPFEYFGGESQPLSLILLLDVSGSMRRYIQQMALAAKQALSVLRPGDQAAVMVFARRALIREDFTSDPRIIQRALAQAAEDSQAGSSTFLNQSILTAASTLYSRTRLNPTTRRVILILTDNFGANYRAPDATLIRALQDASIVLSAIIVGDKPQMKNSPNAANPDFTFADVPRLARETGGEAIRSDRAAQDFPNLMERLRFRYLLQFAPSPNPGLHQLEIRLTPQASQRLSRPRLLHRPAYHAP
jgi:VWFA-related protein